MNDSVRGTLVFLTVSLLGLAVARAQTKGGPVPPAATLVRTIPFNGFTANEVFPADLDGDGQLVLLCLQSPGIYQSDVFKQTVSEVPAEMQKIFCLTAISQSGKVRWQLGKPNLKFRQNQSHVADQMVWCGRLNGGTKPEIVVIHGKTLAILDAATGKIKHATELNADNLCAVLPFHTTDGDRLLVQNIEKGYPPYQYGCPVLILDARTLKLIATVPDPLGSGHSPRCLDLDGDGNDELLLGYDAYDAIGQQLWRMERLGQVKPVPNHVDQLQVGYFGGKPAGRVIYAGSESVVIGDLNGKLIFKQNFGHPQHVVVGDFRAGDKRADIAIYCCRDLVGVAQSNYLARARLPTPPKGNRNNIAFLNPDGEVVNVIFPRGLKYHSGEGMLIYPQGAPDGGDIIITRDWSWPEALNMAGETVFTFARPQIEAPKDETQPFGPGADAYGVRIADFGHDGRAEILIHDQTQAWIYQPPFPKSGATNTHSRLKPVTGQGWYQWPSDKR